MPECALNLSQAAIYLALAPKSNASYRAIAARGRMSASTAPSFRPPTFRTRTIRARATWAGAPATNIRTTCPEGVSDQPLLPEGLGDRATTSRPSEASRQSYASALQTAQKRANWALSL